MADIAKINIKVETSDVKKAVGDFETFTQSANKAGQASDNFTAKTKRNSHAGATATNAQTREINKQTADIRKRTAEEKLEEATIRKQNALLRQQNLLRAASKGTGRRAEKLATGVDPLTGQMARDLGVNRFNTANIAAQFQDIGVTAAMGMNPMTIALQQGTQLSAILNNMGNPLKGLAQAFTQLINPVALLSIGITGLIAVFVQMVDWGKVWETASGLLVKGLRYLKDNIDLVTKALIALMAVGVVTHFGAIASVVGSLIVGVGKLVVALAPIAAAGASVLALAAGFYALGNVVGNLLDFNFLTGLKDFVNVMIGAFKNGLTVIKNLFNLFWNDLKIMASDFLNFFVSAIEKAGMIGGSFGALFDDGKYLAEFKRKMENYKKAVRQTLKVDETLATPEARQRKLLEGVEDLSQPTDYIGKLKPAVENALDWSIDKLTSKTEELDKKLKEAWDKIVKGVEGHKIEMTQEADLLGRIDEDYFILKEKYDLLNKAREAGITLNQEQTKYIEEESVKLGQQADALDKLNQRFDFAKSTTNSFFLDMNHALREGKTLWEAFGDAVTNVLGKILDKITEIGVDQLFAAGKSIGWFDSAGGTTSAGTGASVTATNAFGGVWDHGIQKFATGGIISSPTLFGTRNGAGLMGEAGPEAIMPLTRGANGELGVKAEGTATAPVVVNVINNSDSKATINQRQTSQGTEIDVVIDQLVADKLGTLGSASNTAMNTWNNRQLIAR